jgi:hypothetical protein
VDAATSTTRIADILGAHGQVSAETIAAILPQTGPGLPLLDRLVALDAVDEEQAARAIAEDVGIPYVTVALDQLDAELVRRVPHVELHRLRALPLIDDGRAVFVALADPTDDHAVGILAAALNRRVEPVVATSSGIRVALREVFGPASPPRASGALADAPTASDAPRLQALLVEGVQAGASEIQLVPTLEGGVVRRRRDDGALEDVERLDAADHAELLAALRGLLGRARAPEEAQAATLRAQVGGTPVWLSAVIVPALEGEVARIAIQPVLDHGGALRAGLSEADARIVEAFLDAGRGVLVLNHPSPARAAAVLDALLRERAARPELRVVVAPAPGLPVEGALNLRPGISEVDLRPATRRALALEPDLLVLAAVPGEPIPPAALAGARGRRRTVLLGGWRNAQETIAALEASGLPAAEVSPALAGVVCLAADAEPAGGTP